MPMTEISGIAREIQRALQMYARDVAEEVEQAKKDVTDVLKKNVERDSPERRPSYKKGWRIKKVKNSLILHNKTDYQLTHLLEHGHALRNGDRTEGKPHIRPNEEIAVREFLNRVERACEP
jgi:hypothetical protein